MILEIRNASKTFPGVKALDKVSISVEQPGEIVGLAGENGAGKSTLFKVMTGIYTSDSGEMYLNGELFRPKNYRDAVTRGLSIDRKTHV